MDQNWSVYKDPEPGYPVSTTRSGDKPCAHAISHIPNAGRRQSYPSSQWLCLLMNAPGAISAYIVSIRSILVILGWLNFDGNMGSCISLKYGEMTSNIPNGHLRNRSFLLVLE
ncbi:hypothetical protein VTO58DRAFT_102752 [Aureobasidium pullulans]